MNTYPIEQRAEMSRTSRQMRKHERLLQPDRASRLPYAAIVIAAVILAIVGLMNGCTGPMPDVGLPDAGVDMALITLTPNMPATCPDCPDFSTDGGSK